MAPSDGSSSLAMRIHPEVIMFAATLWLCSACLGSCWSASCDDVVDKWLFGQRWTNIGEQLKQKKKNNIPPSHSIPGVGKTAVVTSYLKELGHKCARSIWGKAVELCSPARILVPCRYISLNCYCLALIWVLCFVSFKGDSRWTSRVCPNRCQRVCSGLAKANSRCKV